MGNVIALGTFDGMHRGHLAVIDCAVALARSRGDPALVYTFRNNPRSVFDKPPRELMTPQEREARMRGRGIDQVIWVDFTLAMAEWSPEAFAQMLVQDYDLEMAVVGEDYTFGAKGAGNVKTLEDLGRQMGFLVTVVPLVYESGQKLSSTRMREVLNRQEEGGREIDPGSSKGTVS